MWRKYKIAKDVRAKEERERKEDRGGRVELRKVAK